MKTRRGVQKRIKDVIEGMYELEAARSQPCRDSPLVNAPDNYKKIIRFNPKIPCVDIAICDIVWHENNFEKRAH